MRRGRPVNPIRQAYSSYYGIPYERIRRVPLRKLEKLIGCRSQEAVRLMLLGIISKKEKPNARKTVCSSQ